jgi:aryl-alcohol dehydrogenase-like predicted oxidoreductase
VCVLFVPVVRASANALDSNPLMKKRYLGNSNLQITPIGIGAWAIGGSGWSGSAGPQDDNDSIAAIEAALDCGLNWVDTAALSGLGHSEEIVARALKGCGSKPYIFTKCERVWDESGRISGRLKRGSIRAECEASLRRLQVEVIDLYQIHWPEPDEDIEEGWTELARLREEGKVRYIGVSNFSVPQMQRAQAIAPVTSLQPPYSLLRREIEAQVLPFCQNQNIGVIVYSPMYSGLLGGSMTRERIAAFLPEDWRRTLPGFREPDLTHNLELVERLRAIGARRGCTPGAIAIAWTLANPAVTGAILGFRSPRQITGLVDAAGIRLTIEELKDLAALASAS